MHHDDNWMGAFTFRYAQNSPLQGIWSVRGPLVCGNFRVLKVARAQILSVDRVGRHRHGGDEQKGKKAELDHEASGRILVPTI